MKNFKTLLLCAFLVVLSSCGSDDDASSNGDEALIAGAWALNGLNYSGSSSTDAGEIQYVGVGQDFTAVYTFEENPNIISATGSYAIELTTTFGGQTITQVVGSEAIGGAIADNGDSTWSIDGSELTVTTNAESQVYTIVTLSNTSLVLNFDDTVTVNQGGVMQTTTVDVTYSFTK